MYDLTGLTDDDFPRLFGDWRELRRRMQLGFDPRDRSYLYVRGRPLVAVWGVGFSDGRAYSLQSVERFVRLLKDDVQWGGASIMLGVPYYWREQRRDAVSEASLHRILQLADIISPWSVGRYRNQIDLERQLVEHQRADRAWCRHHRMEYLPVLWPGFSWRNMKGPGTTVIPREKGTFFWGQFRATREAGATAAYIAMFDEMDEGTAVFKCSNDPPVGASVFQTYEGLPTDFYLKMCGKGARLLRGEIPLN